MPRAARLMTVARAVLLSALIASTARAQAAPLWSSLGVPAGPGSAGQSEPVVAADGNGGVYIVWRDDRLGLSALFGQHLDSSGYPCDGWPAEALLISGLVEARDPMIALRDDGGLLVTWDNGEGAWTQSVSATGAKSASLPGNGLCLAQGFENPFAAMLHAPTVSAAPPPQLQKFDFKRGAANILPDGAGGALVSWQSTNLVASYAVLQRVTAAGVVAPGWPAAGVLTQGTGYPSQYSPVMCADGEGGAILAWINGRVMAQHVFASGRVDSLWPVIGQLVAIWSGYADSPAIASDGAGGAFISWRDAHSGTDPQLFLQHLTASGTIVPGWPAVGLLIGSYFTDPTRWRESVWNSGSIPYSSMVADGAGGAYLAWSDQRSDAGDVFVQRVRGDGTLSPGWSVNGIAACSAPGAQILPQLARDSGDGVFVVWQDSRAGSPPSIYAQHLSGDGTLTHGWSADGVRLCAADSGEFAPQLAIVDGSSAVVAWEDERSSAHQVFAARLQGDGLVPTLVTSAVAAYSDGAAHLRWTLALPAGAGVHVERTTDGSAWSEQGSVLAGAGGEVSFDDPTVAPGSRYGYRLRIGSGDGGEVLGEVWLGVAPALRFALEGPTPNPVGERATVTLTLERAAPATLDVLDVSGRRIESHEVGSLGAGRHAVSLDALARAPAGLYFVRLTQGGRIALVRASVVR